MGCSLWDARQQRQHAWDQSVGMPLAQKLQFGEGAISGGCHSGFLQCVLPELPVGGTTELPAHQSTDSQRLNRASFKHYNFFP